MQAKMWVVKLNWFSSYCIMHAVSTVVGWCLNRSFSQILRTTQKYVDPNSPGIDILNQSRNPTPGPFFSSEGTTNDYCKNQWHDSALTILCKELVYHTRNSSTAMHPHAFQFSQHQRNPKLIRPLCSLKTYMTNYILVRLIHTSWQYLSWGVFPKGNFKHWCLECGKSLQATCQIAHSVVKCMVNWCSPTSFKNRCKVPSSLFLDPFWRALCMNVGKSSKEVALFVFWFIGSPSFEFGVNFVYVGSLWLRSKSHYSISRSFWSIMWWSHLYQRKKKQKEKEHTEICYCNSS